ncbi:MAG: alcohol dehydrogenase catalytic domain-containing protein [Propionibacteriaceae bacterium]|jgi:threonine dehydrogenase-like Zn-dependent dehydrogenase|nr:alcohol dehydrogenase catalytic domain-containing protein [Propionibacteriaceae bacterium]
MTEFPATQPAVQIVGPDQVVVNPALPVPRVGPHEILLRMEACGICFSDTKLAHAWTAHPRKSPVVAVVVDPNGASHRAFDPTLSEADLLAEVEAIASYRGGEAPVVPGHEPVARIVAIGSAVERHAVGERVLVQTDYRHLPTAASNAAFGYTFDGGLEQYALVDERVVVSPEGERFLIPVSDGPTASAVALVEPWACVEAAYAWGERQVVRADGRLLVVVDSGRRALGLEGPVEAGQPASITIVGDPGELDLSEVWTGVANSAALDGLDGLYDDIVYFGSSADTIEQLGGRLEKNGLLNVVLGGQPVSRPVAVDAGRVHYDLIRFVGTAGDSAADGYSRIPECCELRPGDKVAIIGAAGPMGLMHAMRTAVAGVPGVSMDAVDVDDARLAHLAQTVAPFAERHGVPASFRNSSAEPLAPGYSYVSLMVPAPALLAQAVDLAGPGGIVNAFAGFAVGTKAPIDFNAVAERGVYLVGTSGSRIQDMKTMLAKVEGGTLDTNVSLDAVCGIAGVPDAIAAVRERTSGGKIMVYPALADLPMIRLADLPDKLPEVAARMDGGRWTKAAEKALLALA